MTDRKAQKRARNRAGYVHVSGYTTAAAAPDIQQQLASAAEVDEKIQEKEDKK